MCPPPWWGVRHGYGKSSSAPGAVRRRRHGRRTGGRFSWYVDELVRVPGQRSRYGKGPAERRKVGRVAPQTR